MNVHAEAKVHAEVEVEVEVEAEAEAKAKADRDRGRGTGKGRGKCILGRCGGRWEGIGVGQMTGRKDQMIDGRGKTGHGRGQRAQGRW